MTDTPTPERVRAQVRAAIAKAEGALNISANGESILTSTEYEYINTSINGMIGQLTVPMMKFRDPDIKEVHAHLLKLAAWLDDNINEET